jgi:hypothetical protein
MRVSIDRLRTAQAAVSRFAQPTRAGLFLMPRMVVTEGYHGPPFQE